MTVQEAPQPWGYYAPRGIGAISMLLRSRFGSQRPNKRLLRWAQMPMVYDISCFGLKLRCYAEDNATENSLIFGRRNKSELMQLLQELKPGDTFIDLGANCGIFALTAAKAVGSLGRVLAIEPNPAMVSRLRFNIEANGLANIIVVEAAVGESEGEAKLHLCSEQLGKSTLLPNEAWPAVVVPAKTLKSICVEHAVTNIGAIKIDVEGYEDRAILPFLRSVPRSLWPRVVLMEIVQAYAWREGCLYHLQEMGYRIKWKGKHDVLLTNV